MAPHVWHHVAAAALQQVDEAVAEIAPEVLRVPALQPRAQLVGVANLLAQLERVVPPALQRHLALVEPVGELVVAGGARLGNQLLPQPLAAPQRPGQVLQDERGRGPRRAAIELLRVALFQHEPEDVALLEHQAHARRRRRRGDAGPQRDQQLLAAVVTRPRPPFEQPPEQVDVVVRIRLLQPAAEFGTGVAAPPAPAVLPDPAPVREDERQEHDAVRAIERRAPQPGVRREPVLLRERFDGLAQRLRLQARSEQFADALLELATWHGLGHRRTG